MSICLIIERVIIIDLFTAISLGFPNGMKRQEFSDGVVLRYAPFVHPTGACLRIWNKSCSDRDGMRNIL